jgi:hypothetical protein
VSVDIVAKVQAAPSMAEAIDVVYDEIHDLLIDGHVGVVDGILQRLDVESLPVVVSLAFAVITLPAYQRLVQRVPFMTRLRQYLTAIEGVRVDALLAGL